MPLSNPSVTPSNMDLGPVQVIFKGVDLGGTLGGCKIAWEYKKATLKSDQLGDSILDRRVSGLIISVETELAEIANKANWQAVFPHMQLVGSGSGGYFVSKIGESDLSKAGVLTLHPLMLGSSDKSRDYTFYLACPDAKSEIQHTSNGQLKLKLHWNIYPDTSVTPARFMYYGDTTVGLVAASAGAPSFTGTGSGSLSSVTAYSGFTKTETITVKCIGSSSGNDFYISGSLSGPLGTVHVAAANASTVNFTSAPISFTLNQATTQFVSGDTFTIATTAANYA